VFYRCSPHEAPPHEGLPCWASIFIALLGRSWAVEVAQEQVDQDTPVSSTLTDPEKGRHGADRIWKTLQTHRATQVRGHREEVRPLLLHF
jgi:hypothetical protein